MQSYVHAHARTCTHMHVRMCMQVRGQLTAMVIYFTLDLNGESLDGSERGFEVDLRLHGAVLSVLQRC